MGRLTQECLKASYVLNPQENIPNVVVEGMIYNKLGKLEDIEEELNCSIEVLYKALKNGIYGILRGTDKLFNHTVITDGKSLYAIPLDIYDDQWLIEDYKKTWWLEKDRSE